MSSSSTRRSKRLMKKSEVETDSDSDKTSTSWSGKSTNKSKASEVKKKTVVKVEVQEGNDGVIVPLPLSRTGTRGGSIELKGEVRVELVRIDAKIPIKRVADTITSASKLKSKRKRLSADQKTLLDATSVLGSSLSEGSTVALNPLNIDHVIENIFGFIFPGPEADNFNFKELCNFRLVCKAWNAAGVRYLKKHCRIGVGASLEATGESEQQASPNANPEHDIEEELTLPVLPITINVSVDRIEAFNKVMKNSADIPFVMFSLRESLFSEENTKAFIELLQICGCSMEQLLVSMEPSTCTMSFLTPSFNFTKLKRLKLMMKHSKNDYTATAIRQFKVSDRIYPIDGINGIYLLQNLCNASTNLDRLDIHWMPTLIPWSSTFGLKDIYLPKTITKLTLDTMNTDGDTVRNILLHDDIRLTTLKWSIGLPLQTLTGEDVKQCLKKHSKTLRSLYFSIWISRLHHDGCQLVEFPCMPIVEQLSLMGDGGQITPFSFPKIFPKLSSLTLYHQMLDFLEEAIPSKTVKVVRILGAPIRGDVRTTLAKAFPELETLILFPQRDLHSKDYLVSMFCLMSKLRILLSHISRTDSTNENNNNSVNKEEDLPNGLYMRSYRRSTYIVRIESGSNEVTRAVAEALEHLDSISRNPPFTLDAAAFSYL